jgi:4-hydroxy-2-oxoheptanedioate aldolase
MKNKIKEMLEEGEVVFGTAIYSFSPALVEIAGYSGFDYVRLEAEHSWRQDESLEHMIRAADCSGVASIVRVDKGNPYLIRKVLELGALGVMVPHIKNKEEAMEVIRAAKFPPKGIRGYIDLCHSAKYGFRKDDWIKWSNEEILTGVMIEDKEGVENIEEIAALEDLDFIVFGHADYSISIGLPLQVSHPKVMEGLKKIISAAKKFGKYVAKGVNYPWVEEAKKYIEMGCNIIEIGHDLSILRTIWKKTIEDLREIT